MTTAIALPVYDAHGKQIEKLELAKGVFDKQANSALLYQVVLMYQANKRQGTASTKTRKEVSGGGRKPWRQKGTGRARAGSTRSPLWVGGGVVFGPHPRDFSYALPQQMRLGALTSSINARLASDDVAVLDELKFKTEKTKEFAQLLRSLKIDEKCLMLIDKEKENYRALLRLCRNIAHFELRCAQDVTAYDILRHKKLIVTKLALKLLTQRLKQK